MAKKVRLTSNQTEALQLCVSGRLGGRVLASVPSLVKRGLMTQTVETRKWRGPNPFINSIGFVDHKVMVYRLTPLGLEVYTDLRKKWYESALKDLKTELDGDLRSAKIRTL